MLQDSGKGIVQRRKIRISDVRWRSDSVFVGQDKVESEASCTAEEMTEDRVMQDIVEEIRQDGIAKDAEIFDTAKQKPSKVKKIRKHTRNNFGFKWVVMPLAVAIVAVIGVVCLTNENTPDDSLKVTAIQNGIDAVYPGYTPRGYILSDITSENGKITLSFKNAETGAGYILIEESVDSVDALDEYVGETFGKDYVVVDEQGTVVYIGKNGAAWANDEILFKLKITSGALTRKQIATIATTK